MKRVCTRLVLFFALLAPALPAQQFSIDSLKRLYYAATDYNRRLELVGLIGEQFYLQSPDSTLYYSMTGLQICESVPENQRDTLFYQHQNMLLNNAAFVNQHRGKLYEAIQMYERALDTTRSRPDAGSSGSVCLNLGKLYSDIGEYDIALNYLNRARKSFVSNDHVAAGNCQLTIGSINMARGDEQTALNNFFSALGLYQQAKQDVGIGRSFDKIGDVYYHRRDYEQALYYYTMSLQHYTVANDNRGLSEVHFHLARTALRKNNSADAHEHAALAMQYAREINYPQNLRDAASVLYDIYRKEGNYEEALKMHELFKTMSDTLRAQDAIKVAVQEHLKLDYENKTALLEAEQEKQDELNQEALKRQTLISYASIGGGLLLLALLILAIRSYRLKQKSNIEISSQKELIEVKNKEILDSINYANRIQKTLLANEELLSEFLPEYFILFRPKDIVSGDFYWATHRFHNSPDENQYTDNLYLAVCDSTGHGVPGAFMSLLNTSFLNEAINEKKIEEPDQILNHVRRRLISELSKEGAQDGMDGILLYFNSQKPGEIVYAAANNAPLIVRDKAIIHLEADKMPVGKSPHDEKSFSRYSHKLESGDLLIAYTDGFADQFGGPKGKKFKYRQLDELIAANSDKPLPELKRILENAFDSWKGNLEQIDDVLVIGVRLSVQV